MRRMRVSRDSYSLSIVFFFFLFLLSHVRCNNCIFIVATNTNSHTHIHIYDIYTYTILAIYKCISIRQPITCNSAINVVLVQSRSRSKRKSKIEKAQENTKKLLRAMHKQRSSLILKKKNKRQNE